MTNFGNQHGENKCEWVNKFWFNSLKRYANNEAVGEMKEKAKRTIQWCEENVVFLKDGFRLEKLNK